MIKFNIPMSQESTDRYNSLSLALDLLSEYRECLNDEVNCDVNNSNEPTKRLYEFMDDLKVFLLEVDNQYERSRYLTAFSTLMNMAFQKLESDIRIVQ